ncbi:MAG TPA: hypothetical protein VMU34_20795, partial [Mycobacterium sp.]|nr:hypothetical protein [Mycobacterium sp.]
DPGNDPVEVAAVLMDGMDVVVLGLAGHSVPMSRARAVTARARSKGCTLLVTDGDWHGAAMRLEARVSGYEMTTAKVAKAPKAAKAAKAAKAPEAARAQAGFGRISRVRLAVRACARGIPTRGDVTG